MDLEKKRRKELIDALDGYFYCFEEVTLTHALFTKRRIRADVVAIPLDKRFWGYALAFEVKEPKSETWNYATWSQAMRQASDYVYAKIETQRSQPELEQFHGRRVSGAFLFPSPACYPRGNGVGATFVREGDEQLIAGAMQLALHFRVGHAGWESTGIRRRFKISFGPNEVWRSDVGFCHTSLGLITGKRTVGSQKLDVLAELDGIGRAASEMRTNSND